MFRMRTIEALIHEHEGMMEDLQVRLDYSIDKKTQTVMWHAKLVEVACNGVKCDTPVILFRTASVSCEQALMQLEARVRIAAKEGA